VPAGLIPMQSVNVPPTSIQKFHIIQKTVCVAGRDICKAFRTFKLRARDHFKSADRRQWCRTNPFELKFCVREMVVSDDQALDDHAHGADELQGFLRTVDGL
jgi:hypothetical protein